MIREILDQFSELIEPHLVLYELVWTSILIYPGICRAGMFTKTPEIFVASIPLRQI